RLDCDHFTRAARADRAHRPDRRTVIRGHVRPRVRPSDGLTPCQPGRRDAGNHEVTPGTPTDRFDPPTRRRARAITWRAAPSPRSRATCDTAREIADCRTRPAPAESA